ncbi:MAG: sodium:solute symporter family protein [Saprospiraceae bacterium]|nr:sodium:solute symporter family protein [Saprospiraceae bacterium]
MNTIPALFRSILEKAILPSHSTKTLNSTQWIILFFGCIYFGFILLTRRKGDFAEFSVASRNLGTFLIFTTICASYIGPAMTLGLTREGYVSGMMMAFFAMINGLALIWVSQYYAPRIRRKFLNSYSIGDVLAGPLTHNHRFVKILVGFISVWFMASISIAMSYAGGELINNVFGFSKIWSIVIMTSVVILYSSFGGIRATIQTDAFQFSHFVILIPILAFLITSSDAFSWVGFKEHMRETTQIGFNGQTLSGGLGLVLFWMFSGAGFDAPLINRFLASKNASVARRAAFTAGIFIFIWVGVMVFIGNAGAYLHPDFIPDDQVLLHIAKQYFPGILYGVFIIAMIGVVMSTQDTTLNSASIVFSEDIMGAIYPALSESRKLNYARIFTFVIGGLAIIIASYMQSILNVIIVIFSFYLPVMVPVILFSVFKQNHHWQSAVAAMITGFFTYLCWNLWAEAILPATLVGMSLSAAAYLLCDFYLEKIQTQEDQ